MNKGDENTLDRAALLKIAGTAGVATLVEGLLATPAAEAKGDGILNAMNLTLQGATTTTAFGSKGSKARGIIWFKKILINFDATNGYKPPTGTNWIELYNGPIKYSADGYDETDNNPRHDPAKTKTVYLSIFVAL